MKASLSVVMPVYNEAAHLPATIDALVEAVERSDFVVELVLVDDGSTDGSADVGRKAVRERLPILVVSQRNRGRFEARRAGLEGANGEWVLLLDGRVRLDPEALSYVERRLSDTERIWNGHVSIDVRGSPYGAFWNVLTEIAWREYFDDPRVTSFDSESFDHYPKGTTCFLAPRELLREAVAAFESYYANGRFVSDDTALIRWLAKRERIFLSPEFSCRYAPRTKLGAFLRQAVYRGSTFLDGHGRPESRFFPVAVAFFPVSVGLAVLGLRRPAAIPLLGAASVVVGGVVAARARRSRFETLSFALLIPPYAIAHGIGMWRGLVTIAGERLGGGSAGASPSVPHSTPPPDDARR
jgi:glycosyltransferase involved in cell wall biosynthesis